MWQLTLNNFNNWTISKQTKFEKPNNKGIVVSNMFNFINEHTELKYIDKNNAHFLKLDISYDINSIKNFDLSISEEIEKN